MTEQTPGRPRIVVGVDGSEQSKQALRWAARLADAEGAGMDAVAAWEIEGSVGWTALPVGYSPQADMDKMLTDTVDEVFGADRPKDLRLHTFEANPARILLELSKTAHMVVVGSRGHGGFAGLLLGSVSMKLAELAHCPVLVVHGDAEAATRSPGDRQ